MAFLLRSIAAIVLIAIFGSTGAAESIASNHDVLPSAPAEMPQLSDPSPMADEAGETWSVCGPMRCCDGSRLDRLWVVSTRRLTSDACRANLVRPSFDVLRTDGCQRPMPASLHQLLDARSEGRATLIQIHGNRMDPGSAIERGHFIYRNLSVHLGPMPLDYVIFSWPSERVGLWVHDGREKAERTDAEGLYLAWLVRELMATPAPIAVIGFSFGGRIATGAMHSLAGGALGGRALPGPPIVGADVAVGLIAPALGDNWLRSGAYHGLATGNISRMSILYNRRDAVLKRYWLVDSVRRSMALGYTGPRGIGPRADGSPMPLFSRDCSTSLGIRHDEQQYYTDECRAGLQMARLIQPSF